MIFDAFSTGHWDLDGEHEDLAKADQARQQLVASGVAAFQSKFADGRRQVDGLIQLVTDAETPGIELDNRPYTFIERLCSEDFVKEFLPYAMQDGAHPFLAYMTIVAFRWLRATDGARYKSAGLETRRPQKLRCLHARLPMQSPADPSLKCTTHRGDCRDYAGFGAASRSDGPLSDLHGHSALGGACGARTKGDRDAARVRRR